MPALDYRIFVLLPRQGLWDRLQRLWTATDWQARYKRIAYLETFTTWEDTRVKEIVWEPFFHRLINDPIDASTFEQMVRVIEAGESELSVPGVPSSGFANVRLGRPIATRRIGEQLYFTLGISRGLLCGSQRMWQRPEECLVTLEWEAGRNRIKSSMAMRVLLGVALELLEPIYAFSSSLASSEGNLSGRYESPWERYWPSMLFGAPLMEQLGAERLRSTPSFRLIELEGPMVWISGPYGLGNEDFAIEDSELFLANPASVRDYHFGYYDKHLSALQTSAEATHRRAVLEHLDFLHA